MSKIYLNDKVSIDLDKLIESKLLLQANSGGGKSWAARRIIEQAFGKVQIIIIDPEGEFGNMRGKYDFLYIGKGGDAPAEPRSAALLATRLLETKASAIVDIYELGHDRKRFVRLFFEAMVNAPKNLWHDCLVILDEAHKFAPEKDESEALTATADMASLGRKRGFCLIAATQRPAKLSKDVAAELNNKLIGRASLDIDRKRSAEELGFASKEEVLSLRNLEPGEFYGFGPAISRDVEKIIIGDVTVKPPRRGVGRNKPPAPTAKVRALLSQFKDLPAEAEAEARTVYELKTELASALRKIVELEGKPAISQDPKVMRESINTALQNAQIDVAAKMAPIKEAIDRIFNMAQDARKLTTAPIIISKNFAKDMRLDIKVDSTTPSKEIPLHNYPKSAKQIIDGAPFEIKVIPEKFGICEKKIYSFLYENSDRSFTKIQIGAVTGYSPTSGGFQNAIAKLNAAGIIRREGDKIALVSRMEGLYLQGEKFSAAPAFWHNKLGLCERKIYEFLWMNKNAAYPKQALGEETGYSPTSGGFQNAIAHLNSIGLVVRVDTGQIRINPDILDI